jgi:hypothetical protein
VIYQRRFADDFSSARCFQNVKLPGSFPVMNSAGRDICSDGGILDAQHLVLSFTLRAKEYTHGNISFGFKQIKSLRSKLRGIPYPA